MDYNELKLLVLKLFATHGSMKSDSLVEKLAELRGIVIDIHALRMALMRYYKQGLLRRRTLWWRVYVYDFGTRSSAVAMA